MGLATWYGLTSALCALYGAHLWWKSSKIAFPKELQGRATRGIIPLIGLTGEDLRVTLPTKELVDRFDAAAKLNSEAAAWTAAAAYTAAISALLAAI